MSRRRFYSTELSLAPSQPLWLRVSSTEVQHCYLFIPLNGGQMGLEAGAGHVLGKAPEDSVEFSLAPSSNPHLPQGS